ncbi:DNA cytosine methyltransferase [Simplicispira lacusdiani]|uniref:DNA cytosine methyltransferase n=1 Tax=Simplicispira lacusdiani TaxID=2213010 RepID=UPI000E73BEE6|nr:DNA (cytosine-5-)-methyltransferase [Simplicispira lacusdiani]
MPYELTQEQRDKYRATSIRSQQRKQALQNRKSVKHESPLRGDRLDPADLMPLLPQNGLSCMSLFSGGGGLDLGFERAGYDHRTSFELLDICGETFRLNRPDWDVRAGSAAGDVTKVKFSSFRSVDVVHGGPPCQPFSVAGKQAGAQDPRNMWGEFVRCIQQVRPRAFIAENVVGLLDKKFDSFVQHVIVDPLQGQYTIFKFKLAAHDFGVPQARRRVFFVGFRAARDAARWVEPAPTHGDDGTLFGPLLPRNTARASLGLPSIGYDDVAPTLRSGFTGPRNTTGILNSKASLKVWNDLRIWPNGVQRTHELAVAYPPENGHFRLSVEDCALLQGFPADWKFSGAVYQVIGQIGNSVCPPVAYAVARQVAKALGAVE